MNRSNYKHLVNIQQKTQTQDATTGELTDTWANLYSNVFCGIAPLSVKDFIQSQAHQSEVTVRIEMNHLSGLDSTVRFVGVCGCHSGKIYNPAGALEDPDTGQEKITFPCSEGANTG